HGLPLGDLLHAVLENFNKQSEDPYHQHTIPLSIIATPNLRKSSFLNAILPQQPLILSNLPPTTPHPIHTHYSYHPQHYVLIHTPPITKKPNVYQSTQEYS
uniref:GTPase n=1 Tax=Staphylococcus epidermidis TaxID=1282 RepID=UPI0016428BB1